MEGTKTSLIGTILERRYRVDALLARGGMSAVYRGVDTRLDRAVAIKIMDPRFADDPSFVQRFKQEARSAASLHHPHVVAVHDQGAETGTEHNRVFLVMELVDGGTLRDLLTESAGPLSVPVALTVIDAVLSALTAAHRSGLVHRDVKPENVLIGRSGTRGSDSGVVKVADFGLVRAVAGSNNTSSSVILGTVAYLSPEQVTKGVTSAKGDVYSAGVLLFEMLTGQPPYSGDTALSVAYQHVNSDIPAPSTLVPAIPPALDAVVLRATRRDQSMRPADAAALQAELDQVRQALGISPAAVPVPVPDSAEHTAPVSAEMISEVDTVAGGASGTLPVLPPNPPATLSGTTPPGTAPPGSAGPAGPVTQQGPVTPPGPRGTMALSREQLETTATGSAQPHSQHGTPTPPHGIEQPERPGRGRRIVLWSVLGALLLGLIGAGTWWFTTGRWVAVPAVAGMEQAKAEQVLRGAELNPKMVKQRHDSVAAGKAIRSDPSAGDDALPGDDVTLVISSGPPVVPDISPGTPVADAESALRKAELTPKRDQQAAKYHDSAPKGTVVGTQPPAGTQLKVNQQVTLVLSKGPPPKPVPDVTGMSKDEAFQAIRSAGMEPFHAGEEFSDQAPGGHVTRTDPEIGSTPGASSRVGVYLSTAVTVPDLTGKKVSEAERILRELGLQPEVHQFLPNRDSRVLQQQPGGNSYVQPNSKVVLGAFP